MMIYDSRGYSGPMGVTLQLHNTLCEHKVMCVCTALHNWSSSGTFWVSKLF